ncbi:MAG: PLP-dependent lyase/thiolase [Acidimicrobiales bacterium]
MNAAVLRCAVCRATLGADAVWPWRCPNAPEGDSAHVLWRVAQLKPFRPVDDPNPFVAFDSALVWSTLAEARGMDIEARRALVREVDDAVAAVDGTGFRVTPFFRSGRLSSALGFAADGGVWVKDDTVNISGSHKARHLMTILLHLIACERLGIAPASERVRLAIASCGNAALAAATLAAAARWPLSVYVPTQGDPWVLERLIALGAEVVMCARQPTDPPGDPGVRRFREAVADGAIPFSVQGTENALCLDGGRTIGWEITEILGAHIDRVFVQVGGGALAASAGLAFADAGVHPRLHAVQTEGCAPLDRAWQRAGSLTPEVLGATWRDFMWPWETEPRSAATGILDDETYDWLGIVQGLRDSGGASIVAKEALVIEANELARSTTEIDVDPTGTAGLAGLLAVRDQVADDECVVVLFTGRQRGGE